MKLFLVISILFLNDASIRAQDAAFSYHSPFGSDGTNERGLSPEERNARVYMHLWTDYVQARNEVNKPIPQSNPGGYGQAQVDRSTVALRYGHLLETMAELRAFTTQNHGYVRQPQKDELTRMDKVLRTLNLYYESQNGQEMVDFCAKNDPDRIRKSFAPILIDNAGKPRPIPSLQFVMLQCRGF